MGVQGYIIKLIEDAGGYLPVKAGAGTALLGKVGIDQVTANANEVVLKFNTRVISHGQVTMTGGAVQLSGTSKVYKRLILSPHPDNAADMFAGIAGVTISTGEPVAALSPIEYQYVDISTIYVVGTASDKVCWRGEY